MGERERGREGEGSAVEAKIKRYRSKVKDLKLL